MKVAIIGSYPPPFGGISVAVQRLKALLDSRGVACHVYDETHEPKQESGVTEIRRWWRWLLPYWLTTDDDIVHYQGSNWKRRMWIGLLPWRAHTVVSVQGNSLVDSWEHGNRLGRFMIRLALRRTSFVILSNPEYQPLVQSLGIPPERTAIIPAFIPPLVSEADDRLIPPDIWAFCQAHRPLLVANGAVAFYRDQDLYGLDLLIELIHSLHDGYPDVGLFCSLRPITGDRAEAYWAALQNRVTDLGLADHIYWAVNGVPAIHPVLKQCDLMIRPTNTDGDSLSIREALFFGIPVIASDATIRPSGTTLFRNRDAPELVARAREILARGRTTSAAAGPSSFDQIWSIYDHLMTLRYSRDTRKQEP